MAAIATGTVVRPMEPVELEMVLDWAADEGWNPGLHDAEPFWATDQAGFFIAEDEGRPVGSIAAMAYDDRFGYIGLYIVCPDCRGRRVGIDLGSVAIHYLEDRTIGVDGVLAKQWQYANYGFRTVYHHIRHETIGGGRMPNNLVDLATIPMKQMAAYDARHFGAARTSFLQSWIQQPGVTALAALRDDAVAGYGVLRPCRVGYKIGPLFADNETIAEELFQGLTSGPRGAPIYLDIPDVNPAALALGKRHEMTPVFETVRMYRGAPPAINLPGIYGATTLELG